MSRAITLQTLGLTKRFYSPTKQTLFEGLDLSVYSGETVAISGRSGAGKSTLLQLLGTLDSQCEGELSICGTRVTRYNRAALRNQHIGFTFQSFYLLGDYSALDNVLMPARIGRQATGYGSVMRQRAEELLDQVGLSHRLQHSAKLLSGGEKQRVALARALCNDPAILLADEPTGNLDRYTADEIHKLLFNSPLTAGKTIVIVTHDPILMALCQKKYVLQDGVLSDQD